MIIKKDYIFKRNRINLLKIFQNRIGDIFLLKRNILFILLYFIIQITYAQFASNAIHKDSNLIYGWATSCTVQRGYVNISNKKEGKATVGKPANAIGKSLQNGVVSLGDSGVAILTFDNPVKNVKGYDFAVFENSFDGLFLELAFVEVSEDGKKYVRFNAISQTDTQKQVGTFNNLKANRLYNLAGKFEAGFGTPFDLEELKDSLNVNNINYIKIVDVVGSINPKYGTKDSKGRWINDPFPTPFSSSGFDLDAVAILKENTIALKKIKKQVLVYPNPLPQNLELNIPNYSTFESFKLINGLGSVIIQADITQKLKLDAESGTYFLILIGRKNTQTIRLIITE